MLFRRETIPEGRIGEGNKVMVGDLQTERYIHLNFAGNDEEGKGGEIVGGSF